MKKYIQLSDSIKIEYEELSIKQVQDSLKTHQPKTLDKYSTGNRKAYLLENEKVIIAYDDQAFIYNSESDIQTLLQGQKSRNILNGLNPYEERFPEIAKDLIEELITFLELSLDSIQLNDDFLRKVDSQISFLIVTKALEASEFKKYTLHFIALAGETYIEVYGGGWQMIQANDGTWQPYIRAQEQEIDLFTWVYDSINENGEFPSVFSGYQAKTLGIFKK